MEIGPFPTRIWEALLGFWMVVNIVTELLSHQETTHGLVPYCIGYYIHEERVNMEHEMIGSLALNGYRHLL